MPAQDCIGGEQRADLLKCLAAQDLAPNGKSPTLVVVEQDALRTELLLEHLVFGSYVFDHFLLLPMNPAGHDYQAELPGLKNEGHRRQPLG